MVDRVHHYSGASGNPPFNRVWNVSAATSTGGASRALSWLIFVDLQQHWFFLSSVHLIAAAWQQFGLEKSDGIHGCAVHSERTVPVNVLYSAVLPSYDVRPRKTVTVCNATESEDILLQPLAIG